MKLKITKNKKVVNAFTLVELIVVVMIVGILSAIAVPIFQDANKKARQRGVTVQIGVYMRAAETYYTEFGSEVKNAGDLGNFVSVIECRYHLLKICKGTEDEHRNMVIEAPYARNWNSSSGFYGIRMENSNETSFKMRALPFKQDIQSGIPLKANPAYYSDQDYGVSACFNYNSGVKKIIQWNKKGYLNVKTIDC